MAGLSHEWQKLSPFFAQRKYKLPIMVNATVHILAAWADRKLLHIDSVRTSSGTSDIGLLLA